MLSQGDLLIVPMPRNELDPAIRGPDKEPEEAAVCPFCGTAMEMPSALPFCKSCNCSPPTRKTRPFHFATASSRLKANEEIFAGRPEKALLEIEVVVGLMVSHSCTIDAGKYFSFAPVVPLKKFGERFRARIREGAAPQHLLYLPGIEGMPEAAAALEQRFSVPATALGRSVEYIPEGKTGAEPAFLPFVEVIENRVAALDTEGVYKMYELGIDEMVRPQNKALNFPAAANLFAEDPRRPRTLPALGWYWPRPKWLAARKAAAPAPEAGHGEPVPKEPPPPKSGRSQPSTES